MEAAAAAADEDDEATEDAGVDGRSK